ncbi:MAG: hypothetical protein ACRDKY_08525 [Solirubrobacteraceae bacterium]
MAVAGDGRTPSALQRGAVFLSSPRAPDALHEEIRAGQQSRCAVSVCIDLGEPAPPALATLQSVSVLEGPLPEVLMLAPAAASPSADAVLEWLLDHLWLPALVLAGSGGPDALRTKARAEHVLTLAAGDVLAHDLLTGSHLVWPLDTVA